MYRSTLLGSLILFLTFNLLFADTYTTKIKAIDEEKRTVTFEVGGKEKTYGLTKDVKIYSVGKKGKKDEKAPETLIPLAQIKDKSVTITVEKLDDKELITMIKIETDMKKKKKQ
jgi:hypothetical protein